MGESVPDLTRRFVMPTLVAVVFIAASLGAYRVVNSPGFGVDQANQLASLAERLRVEAAGDPMETSSIVMLIAQELGGFDRETLPEAAMLIALAEPGAINAPRVQALDRLINSQPVLCATSITC